MSRLGSAIKIVRRAKALTGAFVAHHAGISGTYLSMIENGERLPPHDVVKRLAESLRIEPEVLLSFSVDRDGVQEMLLPSSLVESIRRLDAAEKELERQLRSDSESRQSDT